MPNGDKVVPATSSEDSSSESENDESGRTNIQSRSKKKKKKKTPHRPKSVARELIPCRHFEPARVNPN